MISEEEANIIHHSESELDLQANLSKFGITPNQGKVYIHLGKHGSKTAPEISKVLKVPRTETYQILKILQNKGIVTATFEKPSRFEAMPFEETMVVLVNNEKERVKDLETEQTKLVDLWKSIPATSMRTEAEKQNRFQMLQGKSPIFGKLKNMIEMAQNEIIVLGSEKDHMKFYHSDFYEFIKKSKTDLKILTTGNEKSLYVFEGISKEKIKQFADEKNEKFSFIIIDEDQVMFFIKRDGPTQADMMAVWADSKTLIDSLKLLFDLIWTRSNPIQKSNKRKKNFDYNHGIREIEQQRIILDFVQNHIPRLRTKKSTR